MSKFAKRVLTVILAAACVVTSLPASTYEVYAAEIEAGEELCIDEELELTEEDVILTNESDVEESAEVAETEITEVAEPEISEEAEGEEAAEEVETGELAETAETEELSEDAETEETDFETEEIADDSEYELNEGDPVTYTVSADTNLPDVYAYITTTPGDWRYQLSEQVNENASFTFYVIPLSASGYMLGEVSYKVGSADPVVLDYVDVSKGAGYDGHDEYKYVIPENTITADTVISVSTARTEYTVIAEGEHFTADSKKNPTKAPGEVFTEKAWLETYTIYIKVDSGYKLDRSRSKVVYYLESDTGFDNPMSLTTTPLEGEEYYYCLIPWENFTDNIVVKITTYKVRDFSKCTIKAKFAGSDTPNYVKYSSAFATDGAKADSIEIYDGDTLVDNLVADTDYTISYENNKTAGKASLVVKAIDSSEFCSGTKEQSFTIAGAQISDAKQISITNNPTSVVWQGKETKLDDLTITDITIPESPAVLTEDSDYKLFYSNNTKPGKASVTIIGINGYEGSKVLNYTITKPSIVNAKSQISDVEIGSYAIIVPDFDHVVYNGKQYKPQEKQIEIVHRDTKTESTTIATLKKGTDYTVKYGKNTNAGTGTVTITGKGNYTGKITKTFTILKCSIDEGFGVEITMADSYAYKNGKAVKPVPTVVLHRDGAKDIKLKVNKDFKVSYGELESPKEGPCLTVEGIGNNYTGKSRQIPYSIAKKNIADKKLVTIDTTSEEAKALLKRSYTGDKVEIPSYQFENLVKSAETGEKLVLDTDYKVTYSNNVNVGTAKITITGKGEYYGSKTIKMTISKRTVDETYFNDQLKFKLGNNQYDFEGEPTYKVPYTGYAYKPTITILDKLGQTTYGYTLKEGVDYKVKYSNNVNAGTAKKPYATINITFKGNYAAVKGYKTVSMKFVIEPWCINDKYVSRDCSIVPSGTDNPVFLGGKKEVKPKLTIRINNGLDILNVNPKAYKVTYSKNDAKSKTGNIIVKIAPAKGLKDTNLLPKTEERTEKGKTKKVLIPLDTYEYYINKADIANATASVISPQTFNGKPVEPKVTLKYNGVKLVEGKDYKIEYENNKGRGIGTVVLKTLGDSNYEGEKRIDFVIK